ncbi:ATP-grasp domain-containing protein [Altibacter sp. HG106]|uniref:ATP-grasp domain-containing protein n=1 Tax=Altibacter sp. HG106 TaxID=3023937 RepID=UPI0023503EA6|nr:hypothetical protein [Altibacter sp. HG106]MDC7994080.1 hypothetical protein [Altibacter sp. HG106]
MPTITLVTEQRYAHPKKKTPYIANILKEYELLKAALEAEGFLVKRTAWDNPNYAWENSDAVVLRTTWDYYERYDEFMTWLESVPQKTHLINSIDMVRWNVNKHYLHDLQQKQIPIVPTFFASTKTHRSLEEICKTNAWEHVIVKPAIGAAAYLTYQLQGSQIQAFTPRFAELLAQRDMLVQPFQKSITQKGEASLMVFGGRFTHAILKKAKAGDFRVQDDFGGTVHSYEASEAEITLAENAMNSCLSLPVYGRVDIMWDEAGAPMVSELELIEPEIWLRDHPSAAHQFARAIKTKMGQV